MLTFIRDNYATQYSDDQRMSDHDDDTADSLGGQVLGMEDLEIEGHEV